MDVLNATSEGLPASFLGMDWLMAINLWTFVAGAVIAFLIATEEWVAIWQNRLADHWLSPASIYRFGMAGISSGFTARVGTDALTLLAYKPPAVPIEPTFMAVAQRFIDPLGAAALLAGMVILKFARGSIIEQLRKRPFPVSLWANVETRQTYLLISAGGLAAAYFGSFFR